jgi:hypothetical protein
VTTNALASVRSSGRVTIQRTWTKRDSYVSELPTTFESELGREVLPRGRDLLWSWIFLGMGLPRGGLGAGALLGVARRSQSVRTACRSSSATAICWVTGASWAPSVWLGDGVDLGGDALGEGLGVGQERVVA